LIKKNIKLENQLNRKYINGHVTYNNTLDELNSLLPQSKDKSTLNSSSIDKQNSIKRVSMNLNNINEERICSLDIIDQFHNKN